MSDDNKSKLPARIGLAALGIFVVIQLLPLGRPTANPAVVQEPDWPSDEVRQLAVRACFDCHSNETVWPWYSHVAPASWLVAHHVEEGREHFNLSRFDVEQDDAHEAAEELEEGEMPLAGYVALHRAARLSEDESRQLIEAFEMMFPEHEGGHGEHADGDDGHDHD